MRDGLMLAAQAESDAIKAAEAAQREASYRAAARAAGLRVAAVRAAKREQAAKELQTTLRDDLPLAPQPPLPRPWRRRMLAGPVRDLNLPRHPRAWGQARLPAEWEGVICRR